MIGNVAIDLRKLADEVSKKFKNTVWCMVNDTAFVHINAAVDKKPN